MEYLVIDVTAGDDQDGAAILEERVRAYLALGWQPCGGVAAVRCERTGGGFDGQPYTQLFQAVTYPDKDAPLP